MLAVAMLKSHVFLRKPRRKVLTASAISGEKMYKIRCLIINILIIPYHHTLTLPRRVPHYVEPILKKMSNRSSLSTQ